MQAYLNAAGEVLATSSTAYTLVEAQAINAEVASVVVNAPEGLIAKPVADAGHPYYHQLESGDGTSLVHYTEVPKLKPLKVARAAEIDARTEELIAEGFVASNGKRFRINDAAMLRYGLLYEARNLAIAYPVLLNVYDNDGIQSLGSAAAVAVFYEEIVLGHRALLASGEALKQQIIDATTAAEVLAVEDNR
jgi:hypothetical protein